MELSYQLQTLEPLKGALDIVRFFGKLDQPTANADEICTELDLTERSFGKAIRRLVTKGFVQMDGNQVYRLTEQGQRAVEELTEYDAQGPVETEADAEIVETVNRRLVMVLPEKLVAGQEANVYVGFNTVTNGDSLDSPADMVVRLSVVNGEPSISQEAMLELSNEAAQSAFRVIPGYYTQIRIRVQVFQVGPNPDDISVAGGMYVDADVVASDEIAELTAFGADVAIAALK